jgi:hypothetical protein
VVFGLNLSERDSTSFGFLFSETNVYQINNVDLVAIRIDNIPNFTSSSTYFRVFTENNIIPAKKYDLINLFDDNIISLSFPGFTTLPLPFQPYIIHCYLATPYSWKFQNTNEFCIGGNLSSGCSGSPIILINKSIKNIHKYSLLGIYYFSFENYGSVDSIALVEKEKGDYLPSIFLKTQVLKDGKIASLPNYSVNKYLGIGKAIKAEELMKIINQK